MNDYDDENDNAPVRVDNSMLAALTSAEIDTQIATARRFPRSIAKFQKEVQAMACLNADVAADCMYALPRKDKSGQTKTIEGPSARFAEIVISAWGNSRAGARVISEDGDFVVAMGAFHDLERNVAIQFEVRRRITDRNGRRFSADMIAVTGNAAASIALRNAVFKGVPKAYWQPAMEEARKVAIGDQKTLANRRLGMLAHFQKLGVTDAQVFETLGVGGIADINLDHLATLRGIATAIKEGDTSAESAFASPAKTMPTPTRQKDAPPATVVEESKGLDDAKRIVPDEEIAEAADDAVPADAGEPKAPAKAAPAGKSDAEKSDKVAVDPFKLTETSTQPIVGAMTLPRGVGTVRALADIIEQWDGRMWREIQDQQTARAWVVERAARQITQAWKTARIDRAEAMKQAQKRLGLQAAPATLRDLTAEQLVELLEGASAT